MSRTVSVLLGLMLLVPLASAQSTQRLTRPPTHLGPWPVVAPSPASAAAGEAPCGDAARDLVCAPLTHGAEPARATHDGLPARASHDAQPAHATHDASQVFDNQAWNGGVLFPGPGVIVMDWGQMVSTPENEVFAATVGYATEDTAAVDLILRLHPLADGFGDAGRVQHEFPLRGLPGSPDGELAAFTLEVFFDEALVPDGAFGWSYEVAAASTGVLLVDPSVEAGIVDGVDLYDSQLAYLATIDAGGAVFTSLYLGLVGSYPGVLGWVDVGGGLPGSAGHASLVVAGDVSTGSVNLVDLSGAVPDVTAWLVIGAPRIDAPFKGGTLVPEPLALLPLVCDGAGHAQLPWVQLVPVPAGLELFVQAWFPDPGGLQGWASSGAAQGATH